MSNVPASFLKEQFLTAYEEEHARTMRLLRTFPVDQVELRPHPKLRTARELAFVFAIECGLGQHVFDDAFRSGMPAGRTAPAAPESWDAVLAAIEEGHRAFAARVRATPDEELLGTVRFFTGPRTLGDVRRIDFAWFLLHDEIHHRGQFSVYLRLADAKVPSIYGPSGDEQWI